MSPKYEREEQLVLPVTGAAAGVAFIIGGAILFVSGGLGPPKSDVRSFTPVETGGTCG